MSRYENEEVDLPEHKFKLHLYHLLDGNSTEEKPIKTDYICAKKSISQNTGRTDYFVKCAGNILYNPRLSNISYNKRNNWKMTKVKRDVYDYYVKFLETKQQKLLLQAERLL